MMITMIVIKQVGSCCPQSIGKFSRQKLDEKGKESLFKSYTILE